MSVISFLGNSHITVILIVATGTECLFAVRRKPFWSAAELSPCFRRKHWLLLPPLARPLKRSFSAEFKIGFPHLGWPFPLAPVLYPGSSVILKLHLGILFSSAASLRLTSCVFSLFSRLILIVTSPESPVLLTCFYQSKSKTLHPLIWGGSTLVLSSAVTSPRSLTPNIPNQIPWLYCVWVDLFLCLSGCQSLPQAGCLSNQTCVSSVSSQGRQSPVSLVQCWCLSLVHLLTLLPIPHKSLYSEPFETFQKFLEWVRCARLARMKPRLWALVLHKTRHGSKCCIPACTTERDTGRSEAHSHPKWLKEFEGGIHKHLSERKGRGML